jgi:hypothetical protein
MSPDITVSSLSFVQQYSDKNDGSLRREISRGASLPTEILIKHQEYVDSRTKQAGIRSLVAIDYYMTMTDGVIRPVRLQCVLARPNDPLVTQAIISAIEAMMVNLLHGTSNTSGLGLEDEIFSGRQQ